MGDIIDTVKIEQIYRCNNVKLIVIYSSLIGTPISLIFLLIATIRMICFKKKIIFLSKLILLIFLSEITNCFSKIIQLLKYNYKDLRDDKSFYDPDTPRGRICQIQIVTSIFSDICTLLITLLISLRFYDVIRNKKRFFDNKKNGILSIIFTILLAIIISISLLLFDRNNEDISYRYDVRDRCTYWCWLSHFPGMICYGLYLILLVFNIIYSCKNIIILRKGYKTILKENEISYRNSMSTPLNDISKDNSKESEKKNFHFTKEEKKRIEELKLMTAKCFIYPLVTIFIWMLFSIYRIFDAITLSEFDVDEEGKDIDTKIIEEQEYFIERPFYHFLTQFFLVCHSILSSIRGIFYGFSFMAFEEKLFFNCFRNIWEKCCFKGKDLEDNEEKKKLLLVILLQ